MNREIDTAFFEGFLDFFDEDAFAVEVWRRDEARLLHAVDCGANNFDLSVIASVTEGVEDMVGLPEGKLGASGADADGILRVIVLATHDFSRIRDWRNGGSLSAVNNLRYEAKEFLALVGGELLQHEAAVLNLNLSQLCREAKADGGQLDVYGAAICWPSLTDNDAAHFEPIERRRDGGDRRLKGLGYFSYTPVARLRQDLEQANVVYVKVSVSAAGQDARLEFETAQKGCDAFVQGGGLRIVNLTGGCRASFHRLAIIVYPL